MKKQAPRPPLPSRYDVFLELQQSIIDLAAVYEETGNEKILRALGIQKKLLAIFESEEMVFRQEELDEAYRKIGLLPHAVRTWLLHYRDEELQ
ncbi:MAG TPA: hypothetical protein VHO69_04200 [Phototrophicaceae bacterium]|nr:hypothetical protein [Phototrophicaceae bacterium]